MMKDSKTERKQPFLLIFMMEKAIVDVYRMEVWHILNVSYRLPAWALILTTNF